MNNQFAFYSRRKGTSESDDPVYKSLVEQLQGMRGDLGIEELNMGAMPLSF